MTALACVLLAVSAVSAEPLTVAVDAALTNGTGWTYQGGFVYSRENRAYYFKSADGRVVSPPLGFAVTGVVAMARRSSAATRRTLMIAAWRDGAPVAASAVTFAPPEQTAPCALAWPAAAEYDRVTVYNGAGDGTLYLTALTLSGVPFVDPPKDLTVRNVRNTSAELVWTDDARAVRCAAVVQTVVSTPERWHSAQHYDFEDCAAEHKVIPRSAYLAEHYPELGGEAFGVMTAGQIQLGTSDEHGWLSYSGRTDYAGVALGLRVRRAGPRDKPILSVTAQKDGNERLLALLEIGDTFEDRMVPLFEAPRDSIICLNTQCSTKGDQRVVLDDIWVYDGYVPASTVTNVVTVAETSDGRVELTGLAPKTTYQVQVTAYDAQDRASLPTVPSLFTTADGPVGGVLWVK